MDTKGILLTHTQLPPEALALISERQRSYIDEFTFYKRSNGHIDAWYAGELLSTFNGFGWK
jgi:hypothetical protein